MQPNNSQTQEKQGYLLRRGGAIFKSWSPKWIVLKNGVLTISKRPSSSPTDTVQLADYTIWKTVTSKGRETRVVLQHKPHLKSKSDHWLEAADEKERDEWCDALSGLTAASQASPAQHMKYVPGYLSFGVAQNAIAASTSAPAAAAAHPVAVAETNAAAVDVPPPPYADDNIVTFYFFANSRAPLWSVAAGLRQADLPWHTGIPFSLLPGTRMVSSFPIWHSNTAAFEVRLPKRGFDVHESEYQVNDLFNAYQTLSLIPPNEYIHSFLGRADGVRLNGQSVLQPEFTAIILTKANSLVRYSGQEFLVARTLSRALAAAHAVGVVHSTLRFSCLKVSAAAGAVYGAAFVSDWESCIKVDPLRGVARVDRTIAIPHSAAPELIVRSEISPATDMYSVGCILYDYLHGEPIFLSPDRSRQDPNLCKAPMFVLIPRLLDSDSTKRPTANQVSIYLDRITESPDFSSLNTTMPEAHSRCSAILDEILSERTLSGISSLTNLDGKEPTKPSLSADIHFSNESHIPWNDIELEKVIGNGSYGVVRMGHWQGKLVAIKTAPTSPDLQREVAIATSISPHENVVRCLGWSTAPPMDDGSASTALIMEYCAGKSTDLYWSQLNLSQKLRILLGSARGIAHLHANGVVHRDIACRNILLDANYTPKVSDFGFSRVVDATLDVRQTSSSVGPVKYMSPEALLEQRYSSKSDVWMFGILIAEILNGELPHSGLAFSKVLPLIATFNNPLTPTLPNDTPPLLRQVAQDCWAPRPEQRPTMGSLVPRLEACITQLEQAEESRLSKDVHQLIPVVKYDSPLVKATADLAGLKNVSGKYSLGSGAYGHVHLAECNGQLVAIKVLRDEQANNSAALRGLKRELVFLSRLNHKNLLNAVDGWALPPQEPKEVALLTEYMANGSVADKIRAKSNETKWENRGKQIALDIATGLVYLHANNVAHCDIKSDNVVLSSDWTAKIADVGIARLLVDDQPVGTFNPTGASMAYASPEQMDGKHGFPSDIWGLAVVIWELYTSSLAWPGMSPMSIISRVLLGNERLPLPADCPKQMSELLNKCWKANPAERPTAIQVVKALSGIIALSTIETKRSAADLQKAESEFDGYARLFLGAQRVE